MLQRVTKRFGTVTAVNNLSLEIKDKEFVVILGPSGCGKTTALRCVAGLENPEEGQVYIGDSLVNQIPPKQRDVAMVFQSYALYPHMTAYENIAFPLKMRGSSQAEIKRRIMEVAQLLRIHDLLNRKPKQLSGGQRQRVALGRAVVREPKAFLMDEPLSNLDAKLRIHMRAELKKLQKDIGVTVMYVTHDQVEAMTMADRICVMNQGRLQQFESPAKTYSKPANTFVADFMGSPPMNFIDCSYVEREEALFIDSGVFSLKLSNELGMLVKETAHSTELILGVRPKGMTVSYRKDDRLESFRARVFLVEPLGDESILDLKADSHVFKSVVPSDMKVELGSEVFVSLVESQIHLFDRKTGVAIT